MLLHTNLAVLKPLTCNGLHFIVRRKQFTPNNKNLLNFATHITAHLPTAHVILSKILICMPS